MHKDFLVNYQQDFRNQELNESVDDEAALSDYQIEERQKVDKLRDRNELKYLVVKTSKNTKDQQERETGAR